jgi:translocation and assembly module TamB
VEEETVGVKRRRGPRRLGIGAGLLLLLLLVAFAILWSMRIGLATDYIDSELARRGVQATYTVRRIGFGSQILENLVIGNPRRPDLTARRVEVQVLLGLTGPRIGLITARGVRLSGRLVNGRVTLGAVDRLLPPPSGLPFRLPDQQVDIADSVIDLATPAGRVAVAVNGRGNLADGFQGRLAMLAPQIVVGGCRLDATVARVVVQVADLQPRFSGPLIARGLRCGNTLAVAQPRFDLDARFAAGLDSWRGATRLRAQTLQAGPHRLAGVDGRLSLDGNADSSGGTLDLRAASAAASFARAGETRFAGRYTLAARRGVLSLDGEVAARQLVLADATLAGAVGTLRGITATPVGPIGDALAAALVRAGRGGADARGAIRLAYEGGRGAIHIDSLQLDSRSGARLAITGGDGLAYGWPGGGLRLDGNFALSGGGFPDARFQFAQAAAGAPIRGTGRIAPMQVDGARLALGEIDFSTVPGGPTRFRTVATIDGPFSGGRVAGLSLPLAGRFGAGGFALGEGCVTAGFQGLQVQNLRLGPARLPLCPVGRAFVWQDGRGRLQGGADLRGPRLAGRLGNAPITIAARRLRVDLAGFAADAVAVRLSGASGVNRLDVASLGGRFVPRGASGALGGLAGDLANVPLLASAGAGRWQFLGGRLQLDGRVTLADRQQPARFNPLTGENFRLTLVDNRIHATGALLHSESGTRVALATIDHDLRSGVGDALLDVADLRFTPQFQPDALTRLTTGVVALVDGSLSGQGRIAWDSGGVRSSGTFTTADMNLAAPFGPVERLSTTIHFTDLLGLTSAPGQEARIGVVRPGIDVFDGVVRYQLRPDYHVAVESAVWPFSGGTLTLDPTILDFSRESTKYLTFRVDGLDAARFIQMMEFSNLDATGTFDGIIPMEFTQAGGRVVGGRLAARPEGGTLSYIGELSDRDLGTYGVLAFNALKSLRYSVFDISLDGALDGEFLTRINLDGIARNVAGTVAPSGGISGMVAGRVLGQLARIPFEFNITIAGRFRALIATARSFNDPTPLLQSVLPGMLEDPANTTTPVQDEESETVQ